MPITWILMEQQSAFKEARKVCGDLTIVSPNYDEYIRFSRKARKIYSDYTDLVEPYGLDESWIDITHSKDMLGTDTGMSIAKEISNRVKRELGITVSIGVSWNKVYAKFGSDYKKPDAITQISRENYRDILWSAPASDLLYVGRHTNEKLRKYGCTYFQGTYLNGPIRAEEIVGYIKNYTKPSSI